MKFLVLAVDYDGTIAHHDTVAPSVRAALGELRAQGIVVVLVTGRVLDDLRRVAGDLHFVDAVVAENGADVYFPDSGYRTTIGAPPPGPFMAALRDAGITFGQGRVVVEANAGDAQAILQIIRQMELPLVVAFNRSRLMVLPQAISKATGLRVALTMLRLSPHNAVGIGDAENDHELLQTCEVGIAVAWGSSALKAAADHVLEGKEPSAVAGYVRTLASARRLPVPRHTRRRLLVGYTDEGDRLELEIRGRNVLIAGDARSGKSWVAGLLCEQLILYGYSLCVIDPEGDYLSLEMLPGVRVLGGADPLPRPRELMRALRHADTSIVIDLSRASHETKTEYVRTLLPALSTLRQQTGLPHRVIVDEAHYFLHEPEIRHLGDFQADGHMLVTYRASKVHPDVLGATQAVIVTRESDPQEVQALFGLCSSCQGSRSAAEWEHLLASLSIGEAVVLPVTQEAGGDVRRIRLTPRLTPHVRHVAKYLDIPVADARAFVFWSEGGPLPTRARTMREFVEIVEGAPHAVIDGHLRRGDFSRWIADVFGDFPLSRTINEIERKHRAHGRMDVAHALGSAVRSRYEFLSPVAPAVADKVDRVP